MYVFKKDSYRENRGGSSRVLEVFCDHCTSHIAYYQKDGSGPLKRMYIDRFIDISPTNDHLVCKECKCMLGIKYEYKKERRQAYRLFADAVTKKIVRARSI